MKITKKVMAAGAVGVLSFGGLGVAAVSTPLAAAATGATAAQSSAEDAAGGRLQAIKEALAGLVTDGTITQEQADQVATTLNDSDELRRGGPGGHGPGGHGLGGPGGHGLLDVDAAAQALDLTAEELRTALSEQGTTLADVAQEQGIESSTLVDALVAAATERIEQAVDDGRLTQERADELTAALPERIAAAVEEELRGGRGGHGHGGPPRGEREPGDDRTGGTTTEEPTDSEGASLTT